MWIQENRSRHQQLRTALKRGYPTDVKDEEWGLIAPLLPKQATTGRPRKTDLRAVIIELRYMVWSGPAANGACCPMISRRIRRFITGSGD